MMPPRCRWCGAFLEDWEMLIVLLVDPVRVRFFCDEEHRDSWLG